MNGFVAKLNGTGNELVYGTFLGGGTLSWGTGIALDGARDAYVVGGTDGTDFPTKGRCRPPTPARPPPSWPS